MATEHAILDDLDFIGGLMLGNITSEEEGNAFLSSQEVGLEKGFVEVSPQTLRVVRLGIPVHISEEILQDVNSIPDAVKDSETVGVRLLRVLAVVTDAVIDNRIPDKPGNYRWKSNCFEATAILGVGNEGRKYAPYKVVIAPQRDIGGEGYLRLTKKSPVGERPHSPFPSPSVP